MPIVNSFLHPGDPTIQANGEYRGTVNFEFDDGRIVQRYVKASDEDTWSAKLLALQALTESDVSNSDANEAADMDVEVLQPYKQASVKQMALAYLRKAMEEGDPYRAYLKLNRFNEWRTREGHSLNQVVKALESVGLEEDEWADMKARFQYLSNAGRVNTMQSYQSVLAGDEWGAGYR